MLLDGLHMDDGNVKCSTRPHHTVIAWRYGGEAAACAHGEYVGGTFLIVSRWFVSTAAASSVSAANIDSDDVAPASADDTNDLDGTMEAASLGPRIGDASVEEEPPPATRGPLPECCDRKPSQSRKESGEMQRLSHVCAAA